MHSFCSLLVGFKIRLITLKNTLKNITLTSIIKFEPKLTLKDKNFTSNINLNPKILRQNDIKDNHRRQE